MKSHNIEGCVVKPKVDGVYFSIPQDFQTDTHDQMQSGFVVDNGWFLEKYLVVGEVLHGHGVYTHFYLSDLRRRRRFKTF